MVLAFYLRPSPLPQTSPQAKIITAALNIRQGPGVGYDIINVAYQGDSFTIIGINSDQSWLKIEHPNSTSAWISGWKDYVQVIGRLDGASVLTATLAFSPASLSQSLKANGGQLVFMTGSGGDIYAINAKGSNLRLLTQGGLDPALSPDGQRVAFTRWGENEGVYLINVDGSGERQIHPAKQPKAPTWSPDGDELVFQYATRWLAGTLRSLYLFQLR